MLRRRIQTDDDDYDENRPHAPSPSPKRSFGGTFASVSAFVRIARKIGVCVSVAALIFSTIGISRRHVVLTNSNTAIPLREASHEETITPRSSHEETVTPRSSNEEDPNSGDRSDSPLSVSRDNATITISGRHDDNNGRLPQKQKKFLSKAPKEVCTPVSKWQSLSFPNCNQLHEMDMVPNRDNLIDFNFLAEGGKRSVWSIVQKDKIGDDDGGSGGMVLKTLRYDSKFEDSKYDIHRKDALVTERLTSSPHIVDIYGFCGQSVLNEIGITDMERYIPKIKLSRNQKLSYARDAAAAVAHLHAVSDVVDRTATTAFAHRDIRPWNFVIVDGAEGGESKLKLHDFNAGVSFRRNSTSGQVCEVKIQSCNEHRSPEECLDRPLTDKIDVYTLGNIFYFILTNGQLPYHYPTRLGKRAGGRLVSKGITPVLPKKILLSKDKHDMAIILAMRRCWEFNPENRPRAEDIAKDLTLAWENLGSLQ